MAVTSKDKDLLETLRNCLALDNAITPHTNSLECYAHRIQWGNHQFYDWLLSIGLMPAKSLRLGPLAIPDEYFADFVRGCIDGDGSIVVYTDRYNTFKSEKYVYTRLVVSLVSASLSFLEWVQASITRLLGVNGALLPSNLTCWRLQYAKHDSIRLLKWIYYAPDVPCLARKRDEA